MSLKNDYVEHFGEIAGAVFRPGHSGAVMELRIVSDKASPQTLVDELSSAGINAGLIDKPFGEAVVIAPGKDHEEAFGKAIDTLVEKGHMKPSLADEIKEKLPTSVALANAPKMELNQNQGRGA